MAVKLLSVAIVAATVASTASLAQIGGPSNLPPTSFKGQQFVDSRGCLYLRAGFGGAVNWVARLDRNHKPICGMPPTGGMAAQAAVAADMAPDATAAAQAPQTATVAEVPTAPSKGFNLAGLFGIGPNAAAPSPAPAATGVANTAAVATPTAPATQAAGVTTMMADVQCYPDAPKLERVKIAGGTALVCTSGTGSTSGWRPPNFGGTGQAQVAGVAMASPATLVPPVAVLAPVLQMSMAAAPIVPVQMTVAAPALQPILARAARLPLPKPPKGWTYAWKDDRLNPLRGLGTAAGQAQQDLIWQRTVPLVLVSAPVPRRGLAHLFAMKTAVSTMSAPANFRADEAQPAAVAPSGGLRVQVGTFGDPANAQSVVTRLAALGLPVGSAPVTRNGQALQIIYAGPFASAPEAASGLASIRHAGFTDAILR